MLARLIYWVFIMLQGFCLCSQIIEPNARHFNQRDGMYNEILFNIFKDSKGQIWLTGNDGVSRFDGRNFRNFRIQMLKKGMGGDVYAFHEDKKGRIWFVGRFGTGYIYGNQVVKHPQCESLAKLKYFQGSWIQSMLVDSLDHVWLTLSGNSARFVTSDFYQLNHVFQLTKDTILIHDISTFAGVKKISSLSSIIPFQSQFLHTGKRAGFKNLQKGSDISQISLNDTTFQSFVYDLITMPKNRFLAIGSREVMIFSQDSIFDYKTDFFYSKLDIINSFFDPTNGDIWVCTRSGAYRAIGGNFETFKSEIYFAGKSIAGLTRDFEGNYWFATSSEGLYMVPDLALKRMHWPMENFKNKIVDLEVYKDKLWYTNKEPDLGYISADFKSTTVRQFESKVPINMQNMNEVFLYVFGPSQEVWAVFDPYNFRNLRYAPAYKSRMKNVTPLKDNRYWMAGYYGLLLSELDAKEYIFWSERDLGFKPDASRIIPFGKTTFDDSIYFHVGTKVFTFMDSVHKPITEAQLGFPPDEHQFFDIGQSDDWETKYFVGRRVVDSQGEEVRKNEIIFHREARITRIEPKEFGRYEVFISGYFINDTTFAVYYYSIVENNYGVFLMEVNETLDSYKFKAKLDKFEYLEGRVSEIVSYNRHLWIPTTNNGIVFYPDSITSFPRTPAPLVFIRQLELPDTILSYPESIHLAPEQNEMVIELGGLGFRREKFLQFRYRISESDSSWRITDRDIVQFGNLDPGDYTFEVQVSTDTTGWSSNTARLCITVQPAWNETLLFKLVLGLLILLAIAAISFLTIRYLSRRNMIERQMIEMKYQALKNQMSPHFLFNSLNAILYLINSNQKEKAGKFLTSFADLLQNVLNQSSETFVPLIDEIEGIQQYLLLEKVQMGDRLEVAIEVDDDLKIQDLLMPPMLVQPMIENAVRHGIMPRGSGKVKVAIQGDGDEFSITVEDNGIGRNASQKLAKKSGRKRPSLGIRNTYERIAAINQLYKLDIEMQIMDLGDGPNAEGTCITFQFPQMKSVPGL